MIAGAALLAALAALQAVPAEGYSVGAAEMFILLFIVLGPLKLLGPFAQQTSALDPAAVRALALRAAAIAALSIVAGGFTGSFMLVRWRIEPEILLFSLGLIFFWVAFKLVMQQYDAPALAPADAAPPPPPPVLKVVFPLIAPPYGIVAVIVLLALSQDRRRTLLVCALVLATVLLDYFAMLYARRIMRGGSLAVMQVAAAVVGVLQVALAVRIILMSLRGLGILDAHDPG